MNEKESSQAQMASAWEAVCGVLGEVSPDWAQSEGTGIQCAVAAIRKLAKAKQNSSAESALTKAEELLPEEKKV